MMEVREELAVATAALWLPGFDPASRRAAPALMGLLRRAGGLSRAIPAFRRAGHREEAALLDDPARLGQIERWRADGRILTAFDPEYPARWYGSAPPALWRIGHAPATEWVAGVGSRHVDGGTLAFCRGVGAEATLLGYGLVSGAAEGCDRAALAGARDAGGPTLVLLPRGLRPDDGDQADLVLSARPLGEPFSTAAAMERNALIYAAAELAFIGHARLRAGGSWHGAMDARRRRLCLLAVPRSEEPGLRALKALGATELTIPADLAAALHQPAPALF